MNLIHCLYAHLLFGTFIKWNDNRCIKKLAFIPFCMYVSVLLICLQPNPRKREYK